MGLTVRKVKNKDCWKVIGSNGRVLAECTTLKNARAQMRKLGMLQRRRGFRFPFFLKLVTLFYIWYSSTSNSALHCWISVMTVLSYESNRINCIVSICLV